MRKIISDHNPTHHMLPGNISGFTNFRKDRQNDQNASDGVAILVNNNNYANEIQLQTELEAVAITTYAPTKITLCSLYLPPNQFIHPNQLNNLFTQLPTPYIISGDFNAHNILWGSQHTDRKGKLIESSIENFDTVLLNDGSPTYFCTRTGKFSSNDLTITDPKSAPICYGKQSLFQPITTISRIKLYTIQTKILKISMLYTTTGKHKKQTGNYFKTT